MPANHGSAAVTPPGWAVDLITKIYYDDLLSLGMDLPDRTGLRISMNDVHDIDVISAIYDYPDDALKVIAQYYVDFTEAFCAISVDNLVIPLFPEKISLT
jgi:hypothetical protein